MRRDTVLCKSGAQRLSASKRDSRNWRVVSGWRQIVLNAFRHQRGIHRYPGLTSSASSRRAQRLSASKRDSPRRRHRHLHPQPVLNAFRHQRGIHENTALYYGVIFKCSTPFGIKEGFTTHKAVIDPYFWWCSTPFGIKEGFTRLIRSMATTIWCAQRLSASKRDSRINHRWLSRPR